MTTKVIGDTAYLTANYHTHTMRCHHAVGEEREYIENAIDQGIRILGFSDHVPCPFKDDYISGIRMTWEQTSEYISSLQKLREEYKSDITIYIGFEAEYIPEFFEAQQKLVAEHGVDYMIMGQHFLENEENGPYVGNANTCEQRLTAYVDSVVEGMDTGAYRYLAHPDLVNFVGEESIYNKHMRHLCQEMKIRNIPLEINILGMRDHRQYPKDGFWKLAGEVGNDVIIGVDAHAPWQMNRDSAYEQCLELVDRYELHLIHQLEHLGEHS